MDVILRGRLASEGDDVFTKSANFTALCEMTWACDFKSVIMAFKVGSSFQGTPTNPTFPRRSTRVSTMASMYCKVACNDFRNFSMVPAAARTSPKKDHGLHSTQATPSSLTRRIVHLTYTNQGQRPKGVLALFSTTRLVRPSAAMFGSIWE